MSRPSPARLAFVAFVGAVFGFVVLPLVVIGAAAFFADKILTFPPSGYTLSWFTRAWSLSDFSSGFVMSLKVGAMATVCSLLLGVPASLAIERQRFPGRETVRQLAAVADVRAGHRRRGGRLRVLHQAGDPQRGAARRHAAGPGDRAHAGGAAVDDAPVCASLVTANASSEEAARSLGASPLQTFSS
jgi:putative spermidine/putrescine transport system permease protein